MFLGNMKLMVLAIAALTVQLLARPAETGRSIERLKVDVYYASRCPDSRQFITKQLLPNYANFADYIDLKLVPFGDAEFTRLGNEEVDFQCLRGLLECKQNMLHACIIRNTTSTYSALQYISCMMEADARGDIEEQGPSVIKSCADHLGIPYAPIGLCEVDDGYDLFYENGVVTKAANPEINAIPWINYSEEDRENAQKDLKEVLCRKLIGQEIGPAICKS